MSPTLPIPPAPEAFDVVDVPPGMAGQRHRLGRPSALDPAVPGVAADAEQETDRRCAEELLTAGERYRIALRYLRLARRRLQRAIESAHEAMDSPSRTETSDSSGTRAYSAIRKANGRDGVR